MLFAVAALVSSVAMAADARIVGAAFVKSDGWPQEAPGDPDGENQPTQVDGSEVCCQFQDDGECDFPSGGPYNPGDSVTLNTYWTEAMPDPIPATPWIVDWTLGLRVPPVPPGNIVTLFQNEPINFGVLDGLGFVPGDLVTFCVAGILELPPQCTGGAVVNQGHGVSNTPGDAPNFFLPGPSAPMPGDDDDLFTCTTTTCSPASRGKSDNRFKGGGFGRRLFFLCLAHTN